MGQFQTLTLLPTPHLLLSRQLIYKCVEEKKLHLRESKTNKLIYVSLALTRRDREKVKFLNE